MIEKRKPRKKHELRITHENEHAIVSRNAGDNHSNRTREPTGNLESEGQPQNPRPDDGDDDVAQRLNRRSRSSGRRRRGFEQRTRRPFSCTVSHRIRQGMLQALSLLSWSTHNERETSKLLSTSIYSRIGTKTNEFSALFYSVVCEESRVTGLESATWDAGGDRWVKVWQQNHHELRHRDKESAIRNP